MALSKNFRMQRRVPSFNMMTACTVVLAFFLIGFWMLLPSSRMSSQDLYSVKNDLTLRRQGSADKAFEKQAKAGENADNQETDQEDHLVKQESKSSQGDKVGNAEGKSEKASDWENDENVNAVNESSESSQDVKADFGEGTPGKDVGDNSDDDDDNEDRNLEKELPEKVEDDKAQKVEENSEKTSDNSDDENDVVTDTSESSQDMKLDQAEGTTEDLKDNTSSKEANSDSNGKEIDKEDNLVKSSSNSSINARIVKPEVTPKVGKDEQNSETGTKIENGTIKAAQFELTTENEETPKNWTTQALESKEEKAQAAGIEETGRESTKKEQNREKEQQKELSQNDKMKQESLETDMKIVNDTIPIVAVTAQPELTTQNDESLKTSTAQAFEPKEEKELVNTQVKGVEETPEESSKEEQHNDKKDWQGQLQNDIEAKKSELEELPQNKQNAQQQPVEEKNGQPIVMETSGTSLIPEGRDKNKETIQKSLPVSTGNTEDRNSLNWKICMWEGAADYIPCLDNMAAIKLLRSRRHFEHRERHCPSVEKAPLCLIPLPPGYNVTFPWPLSRDQIRFRNVPHPKLASYKKDQNWMIISDDKEIIFFPGGGTQFKDGALDYINRIERDLPEIAWGKHTRVVLDVGCGVASFGGYLFEKDVLTMSFAPKDEHEAQVQLALERGIPAILAVMGTKRLVFPSNAYDVVHCARCRVHWQSDDGMLLIEINRILRPGGYFIWSATPVYRKTSEDTKFWNDVKSITDALCWQLKKKTWVHETGIGIAYFQKPTSNSCYSGRTKAYPPICGPDEKPDATWYVPMKKCIHEISTSDAIRASEWPPNWSQRLDSPMNWLTNSTKSLFGQPAAVEFQTNTEHWKRVIVKSYFGQLGINWSDIRNVMDMNAGYGGFAAALIRQPLWVMNVVPTFEPDTLPVIFDRGLFGVYHDWCESFNTYPRTYDLLHVDHLFKRLLSRCGPMLALLEMDRILRPKGWIIFRDTSIILQQIGPIIRSFHWQILSTFSEGGEELMVARKDFWRPEVSSLE